jgi:hypothetical protein
MEALFIEGQMALNRGHVELLLGIGVLALGLGLLWFTFSQVLTIASAPGDYFQEQFPEAPSPPQGPSASFSWDSTNLVASVQDTSRQGDTAIASWEWNFGDGTRVSGRNPAPHTYSNASVYQVRLIVRDANGLEARAIAQVEAVPFQTRSGESLLDPSGLVPSFDLSEILRPVGFSFLTFGMYAIMAIVGSAITRAGWNLIKPKPETVRVRLKPRHLTHAFEEEAQSFPPPPM